MFMMQQCERAKHRLFEKRARDDRRTKLAVAQGIDPAELAAREAEEKAKRLAAEKGESKPKPKAKPKAETKSKAKKDTKATKKGKDEPMDFASEEDDDDLF